MKLSINQDKITLKNASNYSLSFNSPDITFTKAVKAYLKRVGKDELDVALRTISSGQNLLTFLDTRYQILVSPIVAMELANRMILLNDKLKIPTVSTPEDEE
jgi:hypothetical protein